MASVSSIRLFTAPSAQCIRSQLARFGQTGVRRSSSTSEASLKSPDSVWVPPFLPRPLGVADRPSSTELSYKERSKKALDPDRIKKERHAIFNDLAHGYFHDWAKIRQHGGKLWVAPSTVIRADRARYFPDIRGYALTKQFRHTTDIFAGKVNLVAMLGTLISEAHYPNFQFVQINLQENLLKAAVVSLLQRSQRRKVPDQFHPTYLLSSQNLELQREDLGMMNKMIGYVFLVDSQARIRWAAVGFADESETKSEIASLRSCTGVLLKRLADGVEK